MRADDLGTATPLLAAIVNSSQDAIIGKDQNGMILSWNPAAEKLFGYPASSVMGRSISLLSIQNGTEENEVSRDQPSIVRYETVRRHKDGTEIPVALTVSPILDEGNQIVGASEIIRDIGNRKMAEMQTESLERKRADERFRDVVEAAPSALVMVGPAGQITLVNSQTEKLFGYGRSELLGQQVEVLMPERFQRDEVFCVSSANAGGMGHDLYGLRKDGSEMPIEIGLNPVSLPEGTFVLASILDITERKLSESTLKRSLLEKLALLQEVHHRVKNNLQIISSLLLMQASTIEDQTIVAKLSDSQRRVMSMAMIHEQLYRHNDMSSIDFADYVRDLSVDLFSSYSHSALIKPVLDLTPVRLTIEQSIPCGLILNELITNALKYAYPEGEGEILIRLSVEGECVAITVADRGRGLPQGFDFVDSKTLGMSIVQVLTEQLEGKLEIGSVPGASFTVRFAKLPAVPVYAAGGIRA